MIKTVDLFDLNHTLSKEYLEGFEFPWQALAGIKEMIVKLGQNLPKDEYFEVKENVWIHKSAKVFASAYIDGPCIIGANTELRQCAFIRGSALIGNDCVIGNSVEIKNAIIFDSCQVPHFNYVGDSILGFHAHMGAGAITSNIKADKKNIVVHANQDIETGLRKMGAMLGDYVDVGCNSVLNPGTIIGRCTNVYPMSCVRGVIGENCIYKSSQAIVVKEKR